MDESGSERTKVTRMSADLADHTRRPVEIELHRQVMTRMKVFGKSEIEEIDRLSTDPERAKLKLEYLYEVGTPEEAKAILLKKSRDKLRRVYGDQRRRRFIGDFFSESFSGEDEAAKEINSMLERQWQVALKKVKDPEERKVRKVFGPFLSMNFDLKLLFDPDVVTDEIYEAMLRRHVKVVEEKQKMVEQELPRLLAGFRERAESFAERRRINLGDLNLHRLDPQEGRINLYAVDALSGDLGGDTWGNFRVESDEINIATQVLGGKSAYFPNDLWLFFGPEMVFTHETLHLLAGRTAVGIGPAYKEGGYDIDRVTYQRIGLSFQNGEPRFHWLDEAVTQSLTVELLGVSTEEAVAYTKEQKLLDLLLSVGRQPINRGVLETAYFENFEVYADEGESAVPAWNKFRRAVNEAYDSGFLVRLDNFVKENGLDEAIRVMKEDWRKI